MCARRREGGRRYLLRNERSAPRVSHHGAGPLADVRSVFSMKLISAHAVSRAVAYVGLTSGALSARDRQWVALRPASHGVAFFYAQAECDGDEIVESSS